MDPFPPIRRQDRLLAPAQANALLDAGEYGFLAMRATNGHGYGIPISFARSGEHIYFHCAPDGFKLDNLSNNNKVSFCVVGKTKVLPQQFSTAYESVLVFGTVTTDLSDEERRSGLRLLTQKYCPEYLEAGELYMEKLFHRTKVLRLDIKHLTGKSRKNLP